MEISFATTKNYSSSGDLERAYFNNIAFITIGIILSLTNSFTVATILRHSGLRARKEYILLTGNQRDFRVKILVGGLT